MKNHVTKEQEKIIIDLYNINNKSTVEISKIIDFSSQTISKVLKRNNIKVKRKGYFSRKYFVDENYFSEINSHEKAQILGFIYADGCIVEKTESNKILKIGLAYKDINYLNYIKEQIKFNGKLYIRNIKLKNSIYKICEISIANKNLVNNLKLKGLIPNKSLTLDFPSLDQVSEDFIFSFVLGYLEGDGSIVLIKDGPNSKFLTASIPICVSYTFGIKLKNFLKEKLFINSSLKIKDKDNPNGIWVLTITGKKQVVTLLDKLYKNIQFPMERKYNNYLKLKKSIKEKSILQPFLDKETKRKKSESAKIANTRRQKIFWLSYKENIYKIRGVSRFCKEYNLFQSSIWRIISKNPKYKTHKGWSLYEYNDNNPPLNFIKLYF